MIVSVALLYRPTGVGETILGCCWSPAARQEAQQEGRARADPRRRVGEGAVGEAEQIAGAAFEVPVQGVLRAAEGGEGDRSHGAGVAAHDFERVDAGGAEVEGEVVPLR